MSKPTNPYTPDDKILSNYAKVLVNFALNSGVGVKKNEVVNCIVPDVAKGLARQLHLEILKAQAHPMIQLIPTGFDKDFYNLASPDQLTFFPKNYFKEKSKLVNHTISIIADVNPMELKDIDPAKIISVRNARRPYRDWLIEKESASRYTWTAAMWGVEAKAKLVGLSLKDYWQQIISACFLDKSDPVAEWKKLYQLQNQIKSKLNQLSIESVHIVGSDVDLHIKLGADRVFQGGSGRNIPSFELFTSPDWRGTNGWIKFNQPVYRMGGSMDDVMMEFKNGVVTKASAKKGNHILQEMLKTTNANKLGEFSLTDNRLSRLTHVMAETLFDENMGGPYGNTHVAIGMAYRDCYRGDQSKLKKSDWKKLGFNDSAEHTDFVSTSNRTVTAKLTDGSSKIIYKDGRFQL